VIRCLHVDDIAAILEISKPQFFLIVEENFELVVLQDRLLMVTL
jgi:hypothetical protein